MKILVKAAKNPGIGTNDCFDCSRKFVCKAFSIHE